MKEEIMQEFHERLSVDCFNWCWEVMDRPDRSPALVEEMLLLAHASLWHWKQREDCSPLNLSVGYWQVSRAYALAGQYEMGRLFGERCLAVGRDNDLAPFYIGYGHEAVARAELLSDNFENAFVHVQKARELLGSVDDGDDATFLARDLTELEQAIPNGVLEGASSKRH